jgi:hypothetical protein
MKPTELNLMPNNRHTAHVNFFVHPELYKALKDAANVRKVPVSRLYRQALHLYLETEL